MKITLLGAGDSGGVPVYGCTCRACSLAQSDAKWRRDQTSALVQTQQGRWLLDANTDHIALKPQLQHLNGIFLTHFHVDHVKALFDLRWGQGDSIPVYCPPDLDGVADLYKHAGILKFIPLNLFQTYTFQDLSITPLPLNHSKLCYGYALESGNKKVAYLTDTYGLPKETVVWLQNKPPQLIFLDVTHVAHFSEQAKKKHNDLAMLKEIARLLPNIKIKIVHQSHHLLTWYLEQSDASQALPSQCEFGFDGEQFSV